jgi:hypothetical protein
MSIIIILASCVYYNCSLLLVPAGTHLNPSSSQAAHQPSDHTLSMNTPPLHTILNVECIILDHSIIETILF